MSLLSKLKQKQEKQSHDIIEPDFISCTEENKDWFLNEIKTKFPEIMPLVKELKNYGMINGLRNIKLKVNND